MLMSPGNGNVQETSGPPNTEGMSAFGPLWHIQGLLCLVLPLQLCCWSGLTKSYWEAYSALGGFSLSEFFGLFFAFACFSLRAKMGEAVGLP